MGLSYEGRVAVVTGAGGGLGRAHALELARRGAMVVVNDLGASLSGDGTDDGPAALVVKEITAAGGTAVADTHSVATVDGGQAIIDTAIEAFGRVDVVVNNAGILRDRMFVNMSEDDWDAVIRGQLRSTFAPCRVFADHWRTESKAGNQPVASIVNVSSTSGLIGAVGQTNYGAGKAAIAALTVILAQEIGRYGVRVNAIVPVARTRMTQDLPGIGEMVAAPADAGAFDVYHPGNVSPLVAWLLTAAAPVTGEVYYAKGGEIRRFAPWSYDWTVDKGARWSVEEIAKEMATRG